MHSLEEIRNKIKEMENKKSYSPKSKTNFDNSSFPFWNMADGDESTVRFLPDGDSNNTLFWVERQLMNIPFSGVEGDPSQPAVTVTVPCIEMFGEKCPIHQEIRPWYNQDDEELKKLASVYWKKRTFLFQGFVRKTKLVEDPAAESPIRKFWFKPQVFNLVKTIIMDPDVQYSPVHYEQGFDFYLSKGKKGTWADYSGSRWARGATPLTEEERQAIETHGLYNLSQLLPEKPDAERLKVMFDMFNVSVDGGKYDPAKWGSYYSPRGFTAQSKPQVQVPANINSTTAPDEDESSSIPFDMPVTKVETPTPVEAQPSTAAPQSANDILAMIRNRSNK